jgi:hypothetical protein
VNEFRDENEKKEEDVEEGEGEGEGVGTWSEESLAMISAVGWRLFAGIPILDSMGSCWTWT